MQVSWDKEQHQKDHDAFRRWQEYNPRGYVLNLPGKPAMLHRFLCLYVANFSSNPSASLTGTSKICDTNRKRIAEVANEKWPGFVRYSNNHCFQTR